MLSLVHNEWTVGLSVLCTCSIVLGNIRYSYIFCHFLTLRWCRVENSHCSRNVYVSYMVNTMPADIYHVYHFFFCEIVQVIKMSPWQTRRLSNMVNTMHGYWRLAPASPEHKQSYCDSILDNPAKKGPRLFLDYSLNYTVAYRVLRQWIYHLVVLGLALLMLS